MTVMPSCAGTVPTLRLSFLTSICLAQGPRARVPGLKAQSLHDTRRFRAVLAADWLYVACTARAIVNTVSEGTAGSRTRRLLVCSIPESLSASVSTARIADSILQAVGLGKQSFRKGALRTSDIMTAFSLGFKDMKNAYSSGTTPSEVIRRLYPRLAAEHGMFITLLPLEDLLNRCR